MALQQSAHARPAARERQKAYPQGGIRFDLLVVAACIWMQIGLYSDGWAHAQPGLVDTFFTPWHLVLYTGFLSVATVIGGYQILNMWRGHQFLYALPKGYQSALIGLAIFAVGAPFDFVWHALFGFEERIDALLSPAHLFLAAGGLLFGTAPIRAAYHRHKTEPLRGWKMLAAAIISLTLTHSLIAFFAQYAHPLSNPHLMNMNRLDEYVRDIYGLLSILLPTVITLSLLLVFMRSWPAPRGMVTFFLTFSYALMYGMRIGVAKEYFYVVAIAAIVGLLADLYIWRFDPAPKRPTALRWFAFGLPFVLFTSISLGMLLNDHLLWTIHMWLGVSLVAGGLGLLLSYVLVPSTHMPIRQD